MHVLRGHRVSFSNDGNDIHSLAKSLEADDVERAQPVQQTNQGKVYQMDISQSHAGS